MDGSASNEVVLRGLCKRDLRWGRDLRCAARAGAACGALPVRARFAMRGPYRRGLRCAARACATCCSRPVWARFATCGRSGCDLGCFALAVGLRFCSAGRRPCGGDFNSVQSTLLADFGRRLAGRGPCGGDLRNDGSPRVQG
jgi:hypothetical protein